MTADDATGFTPLQRVLVIHSYGPDYQWTRDLDKGIRDTVRAGREETVAVHSEFLDTKYHSSPEYFAATAEFLSDKYAAWNFDVLVVTDNLALEFIRTYRDAVFGPVPTIFTGINFYEPILVEGLYNVTGVEEHLDFGPTFELAFSLQKGDNIWVLGDGTVTAHRNLMLIERALRELGSTRRTRIYPDVAVEDVVAIADLVSPDDVVFLVASIRDGSGRLLPFDAAGSIVAREMPAPVFGSWDFFMDTGVLGGKLASGWEQGRAAGAMTRRVLDGTDIINIPILTSSPNRWIFDENVLDRFDIDRSRLPLGFTIINEELSVWRLYRAEIIAVVLVLLTLLVLVSLLMVNIRRRALTTVQLRESLREKEILLKEIHHRVKNNLQVVSSILNMQSLAVKDPQALEYFKDCETRVHSMALVHEQLYQSVSLSRISMKAYVDDLLSSLYSAMSAYVNGFSVQQKIDDSLEMDLDHAIPVGLVINELVSNAMKYAYPRGGGGTIELSLTRLKDGVCSLVVKDYGVGIPDGIVGTDGPVNGETLGLQLVFALAHQLSGSVNYDTGGPGVEVTVSFPEATANRAP
jgi:two-component sensor histidine kinase